MQLTNVGFLLMILSAWPHARPRLYPARRTAVTVFAVVMRNAM
jgi:hypothetical protein